MGDMHLEEDRWPFKRGARVKSQRKADAGVVFTVVECSMPELTFFGQANVIATGPEGVEVRYMTFELVELSALEYLAEESE